MFLQLTNLLKMMMLNSKIRPSDLGANQLGEKLSTKQNMTAYKKDFHLNSKYWYFVDNCKFFIPKIKLRKK